MVCLLPLAEAFSGCWSQLLALGALLFLSPQIQGVWPSVRGVYSSFHSKVKASLPVPAEPSGKAKQTRFLSGGFSCLSCEVGGVYVGPILLFLLLFLPLRLAGAGGGSEAGEGFAAVPAQPLGSCLALRDDLQLPLPRQPHSRLWLITGLIYVLVSVFSSPHWVQQMWLFLGFVVHCWMLSCHITLGPLVTQSLGCSSSGTPETVPATSSPLHIFLLY